MAAGRLARPGPQASPGSLHGQEQCFIKTGKIREEKCTRKEAGIYKIGPALTQGPRMDWRVGTQKGRAGSRAIRCPPRPGEGGSQGAMMGAWTRRQKAT